MQGLHLTADLYDCSCDISLLINAEQLTDLCRKSIEKSKLKIVDEKFFTFPEQQEQPGGITGAVLLAESHLAIHTWPEIKGITLDVYVCNFSTDNSSKAETLMNELVTAFKPKQCNTNRILRAPKNINNFEETSEDFKDQFILEYENPNYFYGFRVSNRLETKQTKYQNLDVFDSYQWGKLFCLDGIYMTSEKDEFFYHEPMVHTIALTHDIPQKALVIGGGDGGSSEELLKHPSIERVKMIELDSEVVAIARKYLQNIHKGVLDNPKLSIEIGDGFAFVEKNADNTNGERFDLIILDLTDPDTPAAKLYTKEFFEKAKKLLRKGGAMTMHIGSPIYDPERVKELTGYLREVFKTVRPMGTYIPLYGSYWGMACASDSLDPLSLNPSQVEARISERKLTNLNYYNGDTHQALFALPNFYRELV